MSVSDRTWMGVPESRSRLRHLNSRSIFQRWLAEDLMAWASSKTMYCHLIRLKYLKSDTINCSKKVELMSYKRLSKQNTSKLNQF